MQGFPVRVLTFFPWLHDCPYWHLTTAKPRLELKFLLRTCLWKLLGTIAEILIQAFIFFHNCLCYVVVKQKLQVIHMSISKERSGENRPGRKRCQDVASWRFSNNGGASRLGKPSITIPDIFDWNSNWSKIARLSGSNSWCILGCTTWWHISGRFFWNIKNVGWCMIWSFIHTAALRCRFTFFWWLSEQLAKT